MKAVLDKILGFFRGGRGSSLAIVIIAAILVELISVFQYRNLHKMAQDELERYSRVELRAKSAMIRRTLLSAETTMQEHLWYLRHSLNSVDSISVETGRLIEANPRLVGGCIAFIPDYYPDKGRLFETYATKDSTGKISVIDLASTGHDYTLHPAFIKVAEEGEALWSDPYSFGPDSIRLSTYSFPIYDLEGRLAAVGGLDIDMSLLGDSLNTNNVRPSTFCFVLTADGRMAAKPSEQIVSAEEIGMAVLKMKDSSSVRHFSRDGRSAMIKFKDATLSVGYSFMKGTETMEVLKRTSGNRQLQWGWVMLSVSPKFFSGRW